MSRVVKPVSLSIELNEIAEKYIDNFSEFVQECIKREFTKEYLEKRNEADLKKIEERKKIISEFKTEIKENKEEEKYLKQMKEHSIMYGIENALENYNNKFGKKIKMDKFRELIG